MVEEAAAHRDLPSCSQEGVEACLGDLEEVEAYPVASVVGSCPCPAVAAAACLVEVAACPVGVALGPKAEEVPPCPSVVDRPPVGRHGNHEEAEACWEVANPEGRL